MRGNQPTSLCPLLSYVSTIEFYIWSYFSLRTLATTITPTHTSLSSIVVSRRLVLSSVGKGAAFEVEERKAPIQKGDICWRVFGLVLWVGVRKKNRRRDDGARGMKFRIVRRVVRGGKGKARGPVQRKTEDMFLSIPNPKR